MFAAIRGKLWSTSFVAECGKRADFEFCQIGFQALGRNGNRFVKILQYTRVKKILAGQETKDMV